MTHTCHAVGCPVAVPPKMLMCVAHWRMVPKPLQQRVWAEYRAGQEVDKNPSRTYLAAAARAIDHVAKREGKPASKQRELFV